MESERIRDVIVLGGGTAGFLTATALARKLPELRVTVLRSPAIGVIGVGEGTTFTVPIFLHGYLGIDPRFLHAQVKPTYKLGIRFLWGPRPQFFYSFTNQLDGRYAHLSKPNGFYCLENFEYADLVGALMAHDRVFEGPADGTPIVGTRVAYHLENQPLAAFLEQAARLSGVVVRDGTVRDAARDEHGVQRLVLESGEMAAADLYVDCSGFRRELLHKTLETPFVSFANSLFCDRAVIGGWARTNEPLLPYTSVETMEAGWAWQIEHDARINRGYVYSSAFLDDAVAEAEFRRKNPRLGPTRVVRFVTGRLADAWRDNVVAIGNAAGFVEPLEATSLATICSHAARLVRVLRDSELAPGPAMRALYNRAAAADWESVRRFLALHYKFNTRLRTPFWRACHADVDLAGAEPAVEFYRDQGPAVGWSNHLLEPNDLFGWEGYLTMLVGQRAPTGTHFQPSPQEAGIWRKIHESFSAAAARGLTQEEALTHLRSEYWPWDEAMYRAAADMTFGRDA